MASMMANIARSLGILLCLIAIGCPATGAADVLVVLSDDSPPYREVVDGVKVAWEKDTASRPAFKVVTLQEGRIAQEILMGKGVDAIIAVGVQAVQSVTEMDIRRPVLATLIPKSSFDKLLYQHKNKSSEISAIYLDQPLNRQVAFFRIALPAHKRLGVVFGPESQDKFKLLQSSVRDQKIQLVTEKIESADELIPALQRVLAEADALLALPDPLVFNKNNAQSILLTSYRYQDPVIGYSQAYVKAGALYAVFSTPAQIGQQAGEIIQRLSASKSGSLPVPQYPKYFSVGVNTQVARSLGIQMEDEVVLMDKLKRTMEQEP